MLGGRPSGKRATNCIALQWAKWPNWARKWDFEEKGSPRLRRRCDESGLAAFSHTTVSIGTLDTPQGHSNNFLAEARVASSPFHEPAK